MQFLSLSPSSPISMRPQVHNNEANVVEVLNPCIRMPIPEALRVGLDERRRLRQQLAHRDQLYRFDFGCGVHAVTLLAATPGFKPRFAIAPTLNPSWWRCLRPSAVPSVAVATLREADRG